MSGGALLISDLCGGTVVSATGVLADSAEDIEDELDRATACAVFERIRNGAERLVTGEDLARRLTEIRAAAD